MNLFAELKRRNVFRVGIAYLVGAWVYEMTPEGVKKASEIDQDASIAHHTGKKLEIVTIVLVAIAIGLLVAERYMPEPEDGAVAQSDAVAAESMPGEPAAPESTATRRAAAGTALPATSIAVLPFANRSNDTDDLYFTDGVHDDLLTQLAKIHDLTVISRTSVMEYRDSPKNLREIGAELGVGTILEGGVQKVGNRVRINAQLIEVATDRHLWAETFDRELTAENVFELQTEIARKIVQAIAVQLTPEEEKLLAQVPTQNLAAYEAYLRARDVFYGANYTRSQEEAAPDELDIQITRAVALFNLTGDLKPMERVFKRMKLAGSTSYIEWSAYVHLLQRDPDGAIAVLNGPIWTDLVGQQVGESTRLAQLADAWRLKGDHEKARTFDEQLAAGPDEISDTSLQTEVYSGSLIAVSMAHLGRMDEALALSDRLVEENPYENDALVAVTPIFSRAMVRGLAGDADGAIADLETVLNMRGADTITAWELHYDPNWDFMRDDPRFVELATPSNLIQ